MTIMHVQFTTNSKLKTIPPAIQERETSFKETKEEQVK